MMFSACPCVVTYHDPKPAFSLTYFSFLLAVQIPSKMTTESLMSSSSEAAGGGGTVAPHSLPQLQPKAEGQATADPNQNPAESDRHVPEAQGALEDANRKLKKTLRRAKLAQQMLNMFQSKAETAHSIHSAAWNEVFKVLAADKDRRAAAEEKQIAAKAKRDEAEQKRHVANSKYNAAEERVAKARQYISRYQARMVAGFQDCIPSYETLFLAVKQAGQIIKREEVFLNLEKQRLHFQLPDLAAPFPIIGLDKESKPEVCMHLSDRVGPDTTKFADATADRGIDHPSVMGCAQAPGSGKTKLAYDISLQGKLSSVIVPVLDPEGNRLSAPFRVLEENQDVIQ